MVRDQIATYVAAFANAEGCVLILGVEDDGTPTGHQYPPQVVDQMRNVPGYRLAPPQPPSEVVPYAGVELLVFEIPMASEPVQVTGTDSRFGSVIPQFRRTPSRSRR